MKCVNCGAEVNGEICEYCGSKIIKENPSINIVNNYYSRPSTQADNNSSSKTWLWVLGWIFIFPLPLTILLLRKKDMKPVFKYSIIVVAWLLYFLIGML